MIGKPVNRVDGPAKVTGRATYAYEYQHEDRQLYGVIVTATIGHGRIREIDLSLAKRSPGLVEIFTHENAPAQGAPADPTPSPLPYGRARPTLASAKISHYGEAVALAFPTTLEQAQTPPPLLPTPYTPQPVPFHFPPP